MNRFKFISKNEFEKLPITPGVYLFKNNRVSFYIGKAANLRERVKNHFQQPRSLWEQTFLRQGLGGRVGFIKTDSEIEALILEANLIKKYQPKYNVVWRDDKNYFYVAITKEEFPRIFITHQPKNLKSKISNLKSVFVGPFVDGNALKQALKFLRKVFPYRSCNSSIGGLPKHPCLWYQLDRCPAPCALKSNLAKQIPNISTRLKRDCQQNTKNLIKILRGKKIQVLKGLKREMKDASIKQDFKKAAKKRDQIQALEKVLAHAGILNLQLFQITTWSETKIILQKILKIKKAISRIEAYDVSNFQGKLATGAMITFLNGLPDKNFYRKFKVKIQGKPNDIAMIKEILIRRFSHPEWPYPELILIDGGKAQLSAALKCKMRLIASQLQGAKRLVCNEKCKIIKVIALAKRKNELYIEGQKKPILLKSLPREIFNLILQLRDEAHRFARKYHLKLREIDLRKKTW